MSTSGRSYERNIGAQAESPTNAVNMTTNRTRRETDDGADAASSVSTDIVSKGGDKRIMFNTKDQLKKFVTDHL